MSDATRILIVDDHGIVRAGVRSLLEAEESFLVVGEAGDGGQAMQMIATTEPEIVIIDLEMPNRGGLDVIPDIRSTYPDVRILVLTMHDDPAFVRKAIEAGCSGYVVKEAVGSELAVAINAVREGRSHFNVSTLKDALAPPPQENLSHDDPVAILSPREVQVLDLLAKGLTNQEAGKELNLSDRTIATYRARVCEKLGLRTRADLVRYAIKHGRLEQPS